MTEHKLTTCILDRNGMLLNTRSYPKAVPMLEGLHAYHEHKDFEGTNA